MKQFVDLGLMCILAFSPYLCKLADELCVLVEEVLKKLTKNYTICSFVAFNAILLVGSIVKRRVGGDIA